MVLRLQLLHHALAVRYGVHRATSIRAVHELRPLLARRGFAVPGMPGMRLRTLADVVASAHAEGSSRAVTDQDPGQEATVCDRRGRTLSVGAARPGRMHDQPAIKTKGIQDLLRRHHDAHTAVDAGDPGLAKAFAGRVHAPPPTPAKDAPPQDLAAWQRARTQQSSQRICVEHANAEHKQWRALQRWMGRRESDAQAHLAIAGRASDRAARR